jgi:hypothetical protein
MLPTQATQAAQPQSELLLSHLRAPPAVPITFATASSNSRVFFHPTKVSENWGTPEQVSAASSRSEPFAHDVPFKHTQAAYVQLICILNHPKVISLFHLVAFSHLLHS